MKDYCCNGHKLDEDNLYTPPCSKYPRCRKCMRMAEIRYHNGVHLPQKDKCSKGHLLLSDNLYINPDGERSCRICQREHMKNYKESHPGMMYKHMVKYNSDHPERCKAHWQSREKRSEIKKDLCEHCGSSDNLHMHHPDYDKPLLVLTLCADCHVKDHLRVKIDQLKAKEKVC